MADESSLPSGITRRDFLDGAAIGAAGLAIAAAVPAMTGVEAAAAEARGHGGGSTPGLPSGYYPPAETGGKGQPDGIVGQIMRIDGRPNPRDVHSSKGGPGIRVDRISRHVEDYDCVVVGGGISGLAAAKFYRDRYGADSSVLIIDALRDVGGHATRNEFDITDDNDDEIRLLRTGGVVNLDSPGQWGQSAGPLLDIPGEYGQPALDLLDDLGVDVAAFPDGTNSSIPSSFGLRSMLLFPREDWGKDVAVQNRVNATEPDTPAGWAAFLARTPFDAASAAAIVRIQTDATDWLSAKHGPMTVAEKIDKLTRITYRQYLVDYIGATEQALLQYQRTSHSLLGAGIQAVSAADMWLLGLPGFDGLGLGDPTDITFPGIGRTPQMGVRSTAGDSPQWPDGNSSLVRLLVRHLVPHAVPDVDGAPPNVETVVNARIDYPALDLPGNGVRIRLNSLAVSVKPAPRGRRAGKAEVVYVPTTPPGRGPTTGYLVRARHVVMACWNRVTAQILEGLPRDQEKGLTYARKVPLIYARIGLRNWRAFADAKVSAISPRGNTPFWDSITLNAGSRFGSVYGPNPADPDSPALVSMTVVPSDPTATPQLAAYERGRQVLLSRSFASLEAEAYDTIQRVLGANGGDFDPSRDVSAVMLNRWNYGYAHELTSVWDPTTYGPDSENPHVKGRRPLRNVSIANSDSGAFAYTHSAISEAYRAVNDLPR